MKKQVLMYSRNNSFLKDVILRQDGKNFVVEMRRKRNIVSDNIPFLYLKTADEDLAFEAFQKLQKNWNIQSLNLDNYENYMIIR